MIVKILIDNLTKSDLVPEWGLAVYVEYNGHQILLDTGSTGIFMDNASAMGIDMEQIEFGVLSHAHYDHADGMAAFFAKNKKAKFYLRTQAAENCYGEKEGGLKYIGIHEGYLKQYRDRIAYVDGDYEIIPGVTLVPHKTPHLDVRGKKAGMYVKRNDKTCVDCFAHEQSLVFETEKGLVILNSCSHGGADNIIREIAMTYPEKKIYALIGGLHLFRSSKEEVRELASEIEKTGIEKIYTGHCTGDEAFDILKKALGDKVVQIYTGMEIRI